MVGWVKTCEACGHERTSSGQECTGLTAVWCPNHGNCACSERADAPGEKTFDDDACPLHGRYTLHAMAERIAEDLDYAAEEDAAEAIAAFVEAANYSRRSLLAAAIRRGEWRKEGR